jgi:two-component system, NarL family, nitrate/nitrite response regulator NarL
MAIRLVLADSHPLVLEGLESFCTKQGDMQPVARCANGEEAVEAVRQHQPDILLLDIHLPASDGLAVLRQLRQEQLPTRAVFLAAAIDDRQTLEGLRLGLKGVVLKDMPTHLLAQCIRRVAAGEQWLERHTVGRAIDKMLLRETSSRRLVNVLTPRETKVMLLVTEGMGNRDIATRLTVTEGTIKIHLHNIYKKLGIKNRVDLTLYALGDLHCGEAIRGVQFWPCTYRLG